MNLEQSVGLEDLIAFETGLDFTLKMNEAVNSQFLLHFKVNVAFVTLELELILVVLMSNVVMVVSSCFTWKHSCAVCTGEGKILAML